ncbi:hypothetical protein HSX10_07430 [Winogradskyella undariae]|uniref:hypothetical protein n=1 Tax=Winogradskyella undariae TaxID=1285465 RepID=UPI00156B6F4D|nr:hypothetical protein [Winogradskyella undariae]NRR91392.1 hypothetical protein [Winogradskyella undariae]
MPKYSRLKLKLTDIPLESAIKVFSFLEKLLKEEKLDLNFFKQNHQRFTIGETYFLMYYSLRYFDFSNPKSHIRLHIEQIDESRQMIDDFISYKFEIKSNAEELQYYCSKHIDSTRSKYYKNLINGRKVGSSWIVFDNSNLEAVKRVILNNRDNKINKGFDSVSMNSIRIPLSIHISTKSNQGILKYVEMNGVLDEYKRLFSDFLSSSDLKRLSNNLFRESKNDNSIIPLDFLSLNCISKSDLYDRIYRLYLIYRENTQKEMLLNYEKDVTKFNRLIAAYEVNLTVKNQLGKEELKDHLDKKTRELYKKLGLRKKFKYNSTNVRKYDFLCAFFFSFPVIRDSYLNHTECNDYSDLPNYLRTECRNIKLRK